MSTPSVVTTTSPPRFESASYLEHPGPGRTMHSYRKNDRVFAQGDRCDALFYVREGTLRLSVLSEHGREATIALLNAGQFAGEECLAPVRCLRSATAAAFTDCVLLRIERAEMIKTLQREPTMSALFLAHVVARTERIQADLVDQLFSCSEKRLARMLLLLANFGQEGRADALVPHVTQETLAEMVGCTRSRVNFFLNRFRKRGFIEYGDCIQVKKELLGVVLHD